MTMYAPSDVRQITVPDGCGIPHERDATGDLWALDCPPCEAAGQRHMTILGWASHPAGVAPTCDERAAAEQEKDHAQRAGWRNLAGQLATAAAQTPGVPAEVMHALAELQAANAALAAQVAALTAPQPSADTDPAADGADTAGAPVKRTRAPRKTTTAA